MPDVTGKGKKIQKAHMGVLYKQNGSFWHAFVVNSTLLFSQISSLGAKMHITHL